MAGKDEFYVQYLASDKEGNLYMAYDQKIIVSDKEGKKLFEIDVDNWIDTLFETNDGQVLASYYGN